jgi:hypothetical protein
LTHNSLIVINGSNHPAINGSGIIENGNRYNHELRWGIVLAAGDRKPLESPMENLRNKILPRQYFNSIERRSLLADTLSRAAKVFLRKWFIVLTGLCLAVSMTVFAPQAYSQSIRSKDEIAAVLTIENLSVPRGDCVGRSAQQSEA